MVTADLGQADEKHPLCHPELGSGSHKHPVMQMLKSKILKQVQDLVQHDRFPLMRLFQDT